VAGEHHRRGPGRHRREDHGRGQHPDAEAPGSAFIPEVHVKQPIAKGQKPQKTPTPKSSEPQPAGSSKTAKAPSQGITGTVTPVQVGQAMLAAGFPATIAVLSKGIAIVNCESGFNGNASSAGFWGEIVGGVATAYNCPQPSCTQDLLLSTEAAHRSYQDTGWQAWDCPGCEVANGNNCPSDTYKSKFVGDAKKAIQLGGGSIQGGGAAGGGTKTVTKRYAFEVRAGEDYWHAIQRLAEEVRWRAFVSNGIFYYVEELDLLTDDVWLEVKRPKPGIDRIRWEWDMGKPVTELTVEGRARAFAAPPGTVAKVTGEGPANGRYLVSDIQGSILVPAVSITCKKATKPLPEPAPDTKTIKTKGGGGGVQAGSAAGTRDWHGTTVCNWIADILDKAWADGVRFTVISGFRTVAESVAACQHICGAPSCPGTCAGASSNHNGCTGGKGAVDIGAGCESLRSWLASHGNPLSNNLPLDRCHFSRSGG
jgi:hypothetical protein